MTVRSFIAEVGCHQIPERCIAVRGEPMPICARCLGATIGHFAALALLLAGAVVSLWAVAGACTVMGVDWAVQEYGVLMSTNPRRLATGVLGGFGVGTVYWRLLAWLVGMVW